MPVDVMPAPNETDDAFFASKRITVPQYYYYMTPERKAAARLMLRDGTKHDFFRTEDGMADVAIEQIWNAIVGNN